MKLPPSIFALASVIACNNSPDPKLTSTLDTFEAASDPFNSDDGDDQGDPDDSGAPDPGTSAPTTSDGPSGPGESTSADPSDSDPSTDATSDASDITSDSNDVTSADTTNDTLPDETSGDETGPGQCDPPSHSPCDNGTQDPFAAMGLGCDGEVSAQTSKTGATGSFGVRSKFGATATYNTREGSQYAVVGSGLVADLNLETPMGDDNAGPTHCNDKVVGGVDPGAALPAPIDIAKVGGDCVQSPGLVGTGDCSKSIVDQFTKGGSAFDYAELRVVLEVPPGVTALSYDLAFLSAEYPYYFGSTFNDMFIAWLESEKWTGNISFDDSAVAISLSSGFLTLKDDDNASPVFDGTCMRQHAGTPWLTTTARVTPGETITLVFAVFDLADGIIDSYAFLDNFRWGCAADGTPETHPAG